MSDKRDFLYGDDDEDDRKDAETQIKKAGGKPVIAETFDEYVEGWHSDLAGAAIDVFEQEPYTGKLMEHDNCILTSHMGSMTFDCRERMEIEATEEAIRFLTGEALERKVPMDEYEVQGYGL